MSQNKNIVAKNQNFIPGSEDITPDGGSSMASGIAAKKESAISTMKESKNAENGYKNNGNSGVQAANQQATRNKN
jgi:hypothetical protein